MKHRILHLVFRLAHGGTQRQMALVAAGLPRAEFDVQVVALGPSGPMAAELAAQGVPSIALGSRGAFDLGAWWKLRRILTQSRPDLVHVWHGDGIGAMVATAVRNFRVHRVLVTERQVAPARGFMAAYFDRQIANRARHVVTSSQFVKDTLRGCGLPTDRLLLIPDGVPAVAAPKTARQTLLDELSIPTNARLLITVGRLTRAKRIKDLIWATDMLKFFRDDVHLLIVGDGPHRARLELYRRQCEIEDRVHFLGDRSDVPRLLPHCAALLSGGGVAGPSVAVLEAMMAGVPVVAGDTPTNRELIASGETGFLVPLGDRNQFARCAHKLTSDPVLHQRLAAAARRRAVEHFSAERMVNRYLQLYRDALASS